MEITTYNNLQLDKSAVALGKFQGLHKGHIMLIENMVKVARKNGLSSVVFTINTGNDKLINTDCERYSILEEHGVDIDVECDFTPEFSSMTPETFVKEIIVHKLHAKFVIVGEDFRFGKNRMGDVATLEEYGSKYNFEVIAYKKIAIDNTIISSSYIRELIEEGKVDLVSKYMGRDYSIAGDVIYGKQLGRTIGFPTANIVPNKSKILPPYGAYETLVYVDGMTYRGLTNVGDNPTVEKDGDVVIETNIIDSNMDLYGKNIRIDFKQFIRKEKKFNNVDELRKQLIKDKEFVMHQ